MGPTETKTHEHTGAGEPDISYADFTKSPAKRKEMSDIEDQEFLDNYLNIMLCRVTDFAGNPTVIADSIFGIAKRLVEERRKFINERNQNNVTK